MRGNKYLKLMDRWGFINDLSLEDAIKEVEPSILEDLIKEWSALQEASLKTDSICSVSPEIPMVPVSSTVDINPDLIANIALYSDKQIIPDPIDEDSYLLMLQRRFQRLALFFILMMSIILELLSFSAILRWLPLSLNDFILFQSVELIEVKSKGCNHHFNTNSLDCGNQYSSCTKNSFNHSMRSFAWRS